MLLADVAGLPLSIWILVINLPFVAVSYRQIGRKFALKSALAIAGLSVCLALVKYPDVTPDLNDKGRGVTIYKGRGGLLRRTFCIAL